MHLAEVGICYGDLRTVEICIFISTFGYKNLDTDIAGKDTLIVYVQKGFVMVPTVEILSEPEESGII